MLALKVATKNAGGSCLETSFAMKHYLDISLSHPRIPNGEWVLYLVASCFRPQYVVHSRYSERHGVMEADM